MVKWVVKTGEYYITNFEVTESEMNTPIQLRAQNNPDDENAQQEAIDELDENHYSTDRDEAVMFDSLESANDFMDKHMSDILKDRYVYEFVPVYVKG